MDYTGHLLIIIALLVWAAWYYGILDDKGERRNKK
jgi:hypothetical protein